jgi:hypothetical protein
MFVGFPIGIGEILVLEEDMKDITVSGDWSNSPTLAWTDVKTALGMADPVDTGATIELCFWEGTGDTDDFAALIVTYGGSWSGTWAQENGSYMSPFSSFPATAAVVKLISIHYLGSMGT